ncbi:MAG: serine/threonine-protein kinase [Coleofasciculus sp. A1-SPW-01]|uniref:serine/threonine protein kinase n=1 Tax=Coleofasciculus sp. A1-SPW-01 TaxID=3070819 RepID=UPI0032F483C7
MVEQVLKKRYQIQKQLGKNGGRRTLLARDLQTQELVAIKLLTFSADFKWDDIKLFEREAETLQSLSHPAIPHCLDHFPVQTTKTKGLALVQSYIQAKSLEEWVKLGRQFNEAEIKHIAKALLEILMYLHAQHPPVIHRDIKPSNILLGNRSGNSFGQVYLVDFGSVQTLAAAEGSTITVVGTYGYMPPEQFGGRAVPASDLYSLGATLIYLVTGTHPADLPQEDLRIEFEPKISLDSGFIDWLQWMTEPDLNNRLSSADQALKSLEKLGNSESPVVRNSEGSKVQIKKDRNSIEFFIHNDSETTIGLVVFKCIFSILAFLGFLQFLAIGISSMVNVFTANSFYEKIMSGFSGILCLSVSFIIISAIISLFSASKQSTRLRIDQHNISLNNRDSIPKSSIWKLGFSHDYNTDSPVCRDIEIWVGTQLYTIPTENLTDREVDWIASELSNLLDLPLRK